ncbi:GntR family transcriptional regulator [Aneurinibacillus sp. REN35]|uniref:GntR family transcriptional regulator n=1 Tax=Aneurinibacillus sp. REN35 TaxID=3237286 RepID=UPI003529BD39
MNQKVMINNALSALIKESIIEDIVKGKIRPGEKLIEARYAEQFGTSRAPVREAFYLLTLEGVVEKIPRRGTIVKTYTKQEIVDIIEIRNFVEDLAVRRIQHARKRHCIEEMQRIIEQMEEQRSNNKAYVQLNAQFHQQLIVATESDIIRDMYAGISTRLLSLQMVSFVENKDIAQSLAEHRQIVALMKEERWDEVRKTLSAHNETIRPRVERFIAADLQQLEENG